MTNSSILCWPKDQGGPMIEELDKKAVTTRANL
jgi:hypothetical protein